MSLGDRIRRSQMLAGEDAVIEHLRNKMLVAKNDSVCIPKTRCLAMMLAEEKLRRLEGAGVDNWDGYDDALLPEEGGKTLEEYEQEVQDHLDTL